MNRCKGAVENSCYQVAPTVTVGERVVRLTFIDNASYYERELLNLSCSDASTGIIRLRRASVLIGDEANVCELHITLTALYHDTQRIDLD